MELKNVSRGVWIAETNHRILSRCSFCVMQDVNIKKMEYLTFFLWACMQEVINRKWKVLDSDRLAVYRVVGGNGLLSLLIGMMRYRSSECF